MSEASRKNPTGPRQSDRGILVDRQGRRADWSPFDQDPDFVWRVVLILGITIAIVGWVDLALLWHPLQFGNAEWEFGTISAHFDGMPLGTIGLATVAIGLMGLGWRRTTRFLSVLILAVTAGLLAIAVIYGLDVPLALKGTQPQLHSAVTKAVIKTTAYVVTYVGFYLWLAITCWRRSAKPT